MKRILHLIPSLSGGGAERQLTNLVCNTSAEKYSHLVCTFKDSEFFAPAIRAAGHEVCELKIGGKHPWISGTSKFRKVARDYQPDIITTWLFDANIIGRLANLRNSKIPLITTLHSPDYEPNTINAAKWSPGRIEGLRYIDRLTARLTEPHFVACSHHVKKSFQKRLKLADSQIRVIYNAADQKLLKSADGDARQIRRELKIPDDGFVYLTIGRIDALKNHELLLRVFPQVLPAVPQAHLVIVGAGVLENELKKLADELAIGDKVHFAGSRKDIGSCLEMADVFVFPTILEGFGMALVEAMFKELPCVASNIEVLREILTHEKSGLLFDPNKPEQLIGMMIKLFRDPEMRRQLGSQAFKEAGRRFDIKTIASEWEDFYRDLTGKT